MNRALLSQILKEMRERLLKGEEIGDMKVGALLALGHQLEAIFYYLGHELGTFLPTREEKDPTKLSGALEKVIQEYHVGEVLMEKNTQEIIQMKMKGHSSVKDLVDKGIKAEGNFCSFEAGLLAGMVEKMSGIHCFAQELNCSLQTGKEYCQFMIVFQTD